MNTTLSGGLGSPAPGGTAAHGRSSQSVWTVSTETSSGPPRSRADEYSGLHASTDIRMHPPYKPGVTGTVFQNQRSKQIMASMGPGLRSLTALLAACLLLVSAPVARPQEAEPDP